MAASNSKFNVGGVLLNQPFKIRRLGHFGFNLSNMEDGVHFYIDLLGFRISDVMDYSRRAKDPAQVAGLGDPNGYFTRYGTDHHAMVLFPKRVRDALGRSEQPGITVNQITWQVGSLEEVGNAISGSTSAVSSSNARGATCRDRIGTLISTIPTVRAMSSTTASSKSAGTATANRKPCTIAASINRLSCRRFRNSRKCNRPAQRASTFFRLSARGEAAGSVQRRRRSLASSI